MFRKGLANSIQIFHLGLLSVLLGPGIPGAHGRTARDHTILIIGGAVGTMIGPTAGGDYLLEAFCRDDSLFSLKEFDVGKMKVQM